MVALIKAVYKKGVFEPIEPINGLAENEQVTLQVMPVVTNGFVEDEADAEEPAFWSDPEGDAEWAAMTPAEQQGRFRRKQTPEEIEADLRWLRKNSGIFHVPEDQVFEFAISDALLEGSQDL